MDCRCGDLMQCIFTWDNAFGLGPEEYAYNLYVCKGCGAICKVDVWSDPGERWLLTNGRVEGPVSRPICTVAKCMSPVVYGLTSHCVRHTRPPKPRKC